MRFWACGIVRGQALLLGSFGYSMSVGFSGLVTGICDWAGSDLKLQFLPPVAGCRKGLQAWRV